MGISRGPRALCASESRIHRRSVRHHARSARRLSSEIPTASSPSRLSGQLRAFAGLFNARYALIPVELRFVPDAPGGRATIHVVVVDTRAAQLVWKGDVHGDGVRNFTPAVAAGIAGRVADLFTTAR